MIPTCSSLFQESSLKLDMIQTKSEGSSRDGGLDSRLSVCSDAEPQAVPQTIVKLT